MGKDDETETYYINSHHSTTRQIPNELSTLKTLLGTAVEILFLL